VSQVAHQDYSVVVAAQGDVVAEISNIVSKTQRKYSFGLDGLSEVRETPIQ
jgi:hypothetical protein